MAEGDPEGQGNQEEAGAAEAGVEADCLLGVMLGCEFWSSGGTPESTQLYPCNTMPRAAWILAVVKDVSKVKNGGAVPGLLRKR